MALYHKYACMCCEAENFSSFELFFAGGLLLAILKYENAQCYKNDAFDVRLQSLHIFNLLVGNFIILPVL